MQKTPWFAVILSAAVALPTAAQSPPDEPLEIGAAPQFVFDLHVVDNHWAIKYKRQAVQRVSHPAKRHSANPLIRGDDPSHLWVVRDEPDGSFRMYYQANYRAPKNAGSPDEGRSYRTYIAYAESNDGVTWNRPDLDRFPGYAPEPNNVVVAWENRPEIQTCSPCLLEVPEKDRRGYRYLMLYRAKGGGAGDVSGVRLIGSQEGIHWDTASDTRIAHLHSDCHNTISYDDSTHRYVMFCRAKQLYRAWGDNMLDTGASRRVARASRDTLWSDWMDESPPATVMIPDEVDNRTHFNFFYGMPTRLWSGIYWGFLQPFRMNDFIHSELVLSRDGVHFLRLADRPKIIDYGTEGTWDDTMVFASPSWIEVGDQWWIYYSGWDGPHGTTERTGGIGLATIRKEGFVSLRGPVDGGVICTRAIRWPGGDLLVNVNAVGGVLRVRISDATRHPIDGFDYEDCEAFSGDDVACKVCWKGHTPRELAGQVIRLEFFLQNADLYTFRATGETQGVGG